MTDFACAHAAHEDWRVAVTRASSQLDASWQRRTDASAAPTLGFVYFTDYFAPQAPELLAALRVRWPGVSWVGCVAVGVLAADVELFDEPGLVLMLTTLPREHFSLFSGAQPLRREATWTALVHADPATPDVGELIAELSARTGSHYVFGGLASSRQGLVHVAGEMFSGGLSGVGFGAEVPLISRVTQGCQPIGPVRTVTASEQHIVLALDGEPSLPALLRDLGIDGADPRQSLPRLRATLVGLTDASEAMLARGGQFGPDVRVRHLIGLDPGRRAFAVAEAVAPGMHLSFCTRDVQAARRDLVRICTEIRDEVESGASDVPSGLARRAGHPGVIGPAGGTDPDPGFTGGSSGNAAKTSSGDATAKAAANAQRRTAAALYVSCAGRGGAHFGSPSAEARLVRHALGDVPLVGFFAGGEIAHRHLYGYTGVLTVFTEVS